MYHVPADLLTHVVASVVVDSGGGCSGHDAVGGGDKIGGGGCGGGRIGKPGSLPLLRGGARLNQA